jgi:membrane protease YdiL (CAAX protease family)
MNYRKLWLPLLILGTELAFYYLGFFFAYVIIGYDRYKAMDHELRGLILQSTSVIVCLVITLWLCRGKLGEAFRMIGLGNNPLISLLLAALCTLPMFIGFGYQADFVVAPGIAHEAFSGLWAGFNEEIVFRGFAAGLLVRLAGWRFLPAALLTGVLFGAGHLYQAGSTAEAWSIFCFGLLVHVGFFAFYKYWNWNLWFPIFLHGLMDVSFNLFRPADNILLNGPSNIYRGITIGLAIIITCTLEYRRRIRAVPARERA